MSFAGRFRRAVVGLSQAPGDHRPGVELVRLDQPQPLRALPAPQHPTNWLTAEAYLPPEPAPEAAVQASATEPSSPSGSPAWPAPERSSPGRRRPKRRRWLPPSSPAERRQEAVDPPRPLYRCPTCGENHQPIYLGGTSPFAAYGRQVVPEPGQNRPLGQTGDTTSLVRDGFHPWTPHPAAEPPPPGTTLRDRVRHLWYGDESLT